MAEEGPSVKEREDELLKKATAIRVSASRAKRARARALAMFATV